MQLWKVLEQLAALTRRRIQVTLKKRIIIFDKHAKESVALEWDSQTPNRSTRETLLFLLANAHSSSVNS